ncbi:MAG TPA: UDP-3-O-(3-hydroxymyristoyl)glucosamine N-acyltransferase [Candidatus Marinimicrobia bacterium]|nr:UDP-3-O-(3-hydroxymyristoyl)glucosamine N-acyltransferase [Candidatus Neomarinimicrobiota bacterium]
MTTLSELADLVKGKIVGDPTMVITGVSEIQNGRESTITFLSNLKYKKYLPTTGASAVVVPEESLLDNKPGIVHHNPQLAIAKILGEFTPKLQYTSGVNETAYVDSKAKIGKNVTIGPFSVIEAGVIIGDDSNIGSHTVIDQKTSIGKNCKIFSNIHIYHGTNIGDNAIIHSGTVIGSDGFGFVTDQDINHKIPQNGYVIIGNDVEIGANCAIDRGTIGDTIIEDQCKLDNHVHLAHNVRLGKGCLLTAAVTIAGSVVVGEFCIFAGHVGVAPHVKIGARSVLAAKTGVSKSLTGGKVYAGMPAREIREQHKREAVYLEVVKIQKRLKRLEK